MKKLNFVRRACAVLALCAATAITLQAQTFGVLHNFDGTDGLYSWAALIQATDGSLYGTTYWGGDNDSCGYYGCGTIFKITPGGTFTTLYNFCSQSGCTDGQYALGALIQATDGNLYGTTAGGGGNLAGTVFKMTPGGTLTTLYSFCAQSSCPDGNWPNAGLIQATDGNFYGTTFYGGAYALEDGVGGTVFKITPGGTLTTLYSFCAQSNCTDGANPNAALIQAADGNFYGTTSDQDVTGATEGTIFKITPSGTLTTLYSFCTEGLPCTDGEWPSGLIQATDGNLYGETGGGGAYGDGTVFKITPSGALTTLYSFCPQSGCRDGANPYGGLIQATDGSFYGTTAAGGADRTCYEGCGTVFKLTPSGALTTLHRLSYENGTSPIAALVQDTNGRFYGTTMYDGAYGGDNSGGTVFVLSTGLAPFVETQPNYGKPGRMIQILGTNLAGATSVTFNGTPAVFKVVSYSLIAATVPAGATTGTVQVTTPSGVLSSNVPFRVVQ